jgi:hypothetical protein
MDYSVEVSWNGILLKEEFSVKIEIAHPTKWAFITNDHRLPEGIRINEKTDFQEKILGICLSDNFGNHVNSIIGLKTSVVAPPKLFIYQLLEESEIDYDETTMDVVDEEKYIREEDKILKKLMEIPLVLAQILPVLQYDLVEKSNDEEEEGEDDRVIGFLPSPDYQDHIYFNLPLGSKLLVRCTQEQSKPQYLPCDLQTKIISGYPKSIFLSCESLSKPTPERSLQCDVSRFTKIKDLKIHLMDYEFTREDEEETVSFTTAPTIDYKKGNPAAIGNHLKNVTLEIFDSKKKTKIFSKKNISSSEIVASLKYDFTEEDDDDEEDEADDDDIPEDIFTDKKKSPKKRKPKADEKKDGEKRVRFECQVSYELDNGKRIQLPSAELVCVLKELNTVTELSLELAEENEEFLFKDVVSSQKKNQNDFPFGSPDLVDEDEEEDEDDDEDSDSEGNNYLSQMILKNDKNYLKKKSVGKYQLKFKLDELKRLPRLKLKLTTANNDLFLPDISSFEIKVQRTNSNQSSKKKKETFLFEELFENNFQSLNDGVLIIPKEDIWKNLSSSSYRGEEDDKENEKSRTDQNRFLIPSVYEVKIVYEEKRPFLVPLLPKDQRKCELLLTIKLKEGKPTEIYFPKETLYRVQSAPVTTNTKDSERRTIGKEIVLSLQDGSGNVCAVKESYLMSCEIKMPANTASTVPFPRLESTQKNGIVQGVLSDDRREFSFSCLRIEWNEKISSSIKEGDYELLFRFTDSKKTKKGSPPLLSRVVSFHLSNNSNLLVLKKQLQEQLEPILLKYREFQDISSEYKQCNIELENQKSLLTRSILTVNDDLEELRKLQDSRESELDYMKSHITQVRQMKKRNNFPDPMKINQAIREYNNNNNNSSGNNNSTCNELLGLMVELCFVQGVAEARILSWASAESIDAVVVENSNLAKIFIVWE